MDPGSCRCVTTGNKHPARCYEVCLKYVSQVPSLNHSIHWTDMFNLTKNKCKSLLIQVFNIQVGAAVLLINRWNEACVAPCVTRTQWNQKTMAAITITGKTSVKCWGRSCACACVGVNKWKCNRQIWVRYQLHIYIQWQNSGEHKVTNRWRHHIGYKGST